MPALRLFGCIMARAITNVDRYQCLLSDLRRAKVALLQAQNAYDRFLIQHRLAHTAPTAPNSQIPQLTRERPRPPSPAL